MSDVEGDRPAIALLLCVGSPTVIAGQAPDIGGILGTILNSALVNQARQEWQIRPMADCGCLDAHNLSADPLAANGVGPSDPRVQRILAQCAKEATNLSNVPISPNATASSGSNPDFVVEGLEVGTAVYPVSPSYEAYKCQPSQEFPGFTWCATMRRGTVIPMINF
jgi:hypothetical protein